MPVGGRAGSIFRATGICSRAFSDQLYPRRHSRESGNPVLFQCPGPPAEPVPAKAGAGVTIIPFERKVL